MPIRDRVLHVEVPHSVNQGWRIERYFQVAKFSHLDSLHNLIGIRKVRLWLDAILFKVLMQKAKISDQVFLDHLHKLQ